MAKEKFKLLAGADDAHKEEKKAKEVSKDPKAELKASVKVEGKPAVFSDNSSIRTESTHNIDKHAERIIKKGQGSSEQVK